MQTSTEKNKNENWEKKQQTRTTKSIERGEMFHASHYSYTFIYNIISIWKKNCCRANE